MSSNTPTLNSKVEHLKQIIGDMGSALVAFSGGVDSTLLLYVSHEVLGERVVAATATSPLYPAIEVDGALVLIKQLKVKHLLFKTDVLSQEEFSSNPPERCYFCKKALFGQLCALAKQNGCRYVLDGSNADDLSDFRPGARAARELGVRSPLQEAGLNKSEIRTLLKQFGLSNWDKPSFACLATRFPYGEPITAPKLQQVGQAEEYLHQLGITQLRVRYHQSIARIEVTPEQMPLLLSKRQEITHRLQQLGFAYVTLDLLGYRTGSMNETLDA